jgi:hypothetical protein
MHRSRQTIQQSRDLYLTIYTSQCLEHSLAAGHLLKIEEPHASPQLPPISALKGEMERSKEQQRELISRCPQACLPRSPSPLCNSFTLSSLQYRTFADSQTSLALRLQSSLLEAPNLSCDSSLASRKRNILQLMDQSHPPWNCRGV